MLESISRMLIDLGIAVLIIVVGGLFVWGIKLAIEEPEYQSKSKLIRILLIIFEGVRNAVQFAGIIGLGLLYVIVLVILPAYVVIHFVVKYW